MGKKKKKMMMMMIIIIMIMMMVQKITPGSKSGVTRANPSLPKKSKLHRIP